MSVFGELICSEKKLRLSLGKALREDSPNGTERVFDYHIGSREEPRNYEREELTKSLWKFLADTQGCKLVVKLEFQMSNEELGYTEIGGDGPNDISFEDYLRDWPRKT